MNKQKIFEEFQVAYNEIKGKRKIITFFGSARLKKNNKYYRIARYITKTLALRGFTIFSGGSCGLMEAFNSGANIGENKSYGLTINLPKEDSANKYVEKEINFNYFFLRKLFLTCYSDAIIVFPGGYGTMDECFEVLTLIQTGKVPKIPIFLYGIDYWSKLYEFLKESMLKEQCINKEDLKLFKLVDNIEEILKELN